MTKAEARKMERLERLLEVERERAEKAWSGYRDALYKNVDLEMQIRAIKEALGVWVES